jgi:Domain of unknown function (DUF1992)
MPRLELVEDEISRNLAEALASGELRSAKGYGAPLIEGEGWSDTPDGLRMPFKILKDAGVVPHEVEMMKERADLRAQLEHATDGEQRRAITSRLAILEQSISLRLESLRTQS